jgi:hypothetical protein
MTQSRSNYRCAHDLTVETDAPAGLPTTPGHNQSVDVSYFAQTLDGHRA